MKYKSYTIICFAAFVLFFGCKKKVEEIPAAPVITNEPVEVASPTITMLSDTSAKAEGTIVHGGSIPISSVGFCWDTISEPTIYSKVSINSPTVGIMTSCYLSQLLPNKKYYVRAFLQNAEGAFYGKETSFMTSAGWYKLESGLLDGRTINCIASYGNILYLGTENGVYFSADTGNTWKSIGLPGKTISSISFVWPTLYAGCSPYVYRSDDNGNKWTISSAFPVANFQYQISKLAFSGDRIYAVATFYAYVSYDGGANWTRLVNDLNNVQGYLLGIASIGSTIIIVSSQSQVYVSINSGQNWTLAPFSGAGATQPFSLNVVADRFLISYNNSQGYQSVDGYTWEEATMFPANPAAIYSEGAEIFTCGYKDGSTKAYLSTNSGQSWNSYSFLGFGGMFPSKLMSTQEYLFGVSPDNGLFRRKK